MSCKEQQESWEKCLAKSGRQPGKCGKMEADLRKCSAASKEDFCIDETVSLMNCTTKASRDDSLCAKEFVNFRECRRPFGRQLVLDSTTSGFTVVEAAKTLYVDEGRVLRAGVPSASANLKTAAEEYAKNLGLGGGVADLRF